MFRVHTWKWKWALLAFGVSTGLVAWEHFLNTRLLGVAREAAPLAQILPRLALESLLCLPIVALALAAGLRLARRLATPPEGGFLGLLGSAAVVSVAFFLLMVPAMGLRKIAVEWANESLPFFAAAQAGSEAGDPLLCSFASVRNGWGADPSTGASGWLAFGARSALLDQLAVFPLVLLGLFVLAIPRRSLRALPRPVWFRVAAPATFAVVALALVGPFAARPELAQSPPVFDRVYDVSAIHVSMTLNRFGDHDAGAYMYVLDQNIQAVRDQETAQLPNRVSTGLRKDPIQPLVIRANVGETVQINFTNLLTDGPAALHIDGLQYTVEGTTGTAIGTNPDIFANPGQTVHYTVFVPSDPFAEHAYYMHDHGGNRERISHGLLGAFVVEPEDSIHLDPETGTPLTATTGGSNWEAIIVPPATHFQPPFREYVLMYHEIGNEDFDEILDAKGDDLPVVDDLAGIYRPAARAINYRSEPFRNRLMLKETAKSHGYGSYTFGDPATPIPRSYLGEPTKTRLMHGGTEVFHVHHLHGGADRWSANPRAESPTMFSQGFQKKPDPGASMTDKDSQGIGPGTSYDLEHECGAGGCQMAAGDFLFHCHIGHHYVAGMWAFWRVFDTAQPDLAPVPGTMPPMAVDSVELLQLVSKNGLILHSRDGRLVVPDALLVDPTTQVSFEEFVEEQLPPPGVPIDDEDATVWNWMKETTPLGPLYKGEPETIAFWANYASPTPGERPVIAFNPTNGRYAWPLFRPHLGQRPPFTGSGHTGAPWLGERGSTVRPDGLVPTPATIGDPYQKIRQYPITAIEIPIQVTSSEIDEDGKIFVLSEDKASVLAGLKPAEPLVVRSNVGDGVDIILTSEQTDSSENNFHAKVNMHTHFVQFDPQASDGVITGLSYEQSVRPYLTENRFLTAPVAAGAIQIAVTHVDRLRPGIWLGVGLGLGITADPNPAADPRLGGIRPITEIRRISRIAGNVVILDEPLDLPHAAGEAVGVEFVRYNWYSDIDFGTVFWHDHVDFKNWNHGLFGSHIVEPRGATYHDPITGAEVRSGTLVDIHVDGTQADPEDPYSSSVGHAMPAGMGFREFMVFLHNRTSGGEDEPGASINLRSEPLDSSRLSNRPFSSVLHGDPFTQIPRAYVGDPFVIRGLGVVENTGALRVVGQRFRFERFTADGVSLRDTAELFISDRMDLVLDGGVGPYAGDYLYYSTQADNLLDGAWGILRVLSQPTNLQPLPGNPPAAWPSVPSYGAPVRHYNVRITDTEIAYDSDNQDGDGVAYVLETGGGGPPSVTEPLVLRVNAGEVLQVKLWNKLAEPAGFTVGKLRFNPHTSYGTQVGFNADSSTPPDGRRTYRFYADETMIGTALALNLAQPPTVARGAFAAVIVEPPGSFYRDPQTGQPIQSGIVADILSPAGHFREAVLLFNDEDPRIGQNTMPYHTEVDDFAGISYSAQRLEDRDLEDNRKMVFSTSLWGDPRIVVRAHSGDPVVLRVGHAWGEQAQVFAVEGHRFPREPGLTGALQMFSDLLLPGRTIDAPLLGGAGAPGDYLLKNSRQPFLEAGIWAFLRVYPPGIGPVLPLP